MKRRNFIKLLSSATLLPGLLSPFSVIAASENFLINELLSNIEDDRVLVVIYLNGGNDGLNTVIPLDQYSPLSAARSNILINSSQVLSLNGYSNVGLHPAMTGMQSLFNNDKLQIIQSVGYPSPNFSHFRSTDIWASASDSNQVLSTGWLGRYLDKQYPGFPNGYPNANMPDPLSIQIGSSLPLMFQSNAANLSMSVSSPSIFNNLVTGQIDPAPATPAGDELTYLRLIASQTQSYASSIQTAYSNVTAQYSGYPTTGTNYLADILKVIARLIKGGLKTKIYSVSLGGFDTHASQVVNGSTQTGTHAQLLTMLSQAVTAFQADLEFLGVNDRVLGMTFSEFGRRILSNSSLGTDHGAAGPMFLFGTKVQGGILGTNPIIPSTVTANDNIPMQYDFRSVYATILKNWFCVNQTDLDSIMLQPFPILPILNSSCSTISIDKIKSLEELIQIKANPNPFVNSMYVDVKVIDGPMMLSLFDALGKQIAIIANEKKLNAGEYRYWYEGDELKSGNYYLRLECGPVQKSIHVLKVKN